MAFVSRRDGRCAVAAVHEPEVFRIPFAAGIDTGYHVIQVGAVVHPVDMAFCHVFKAV